MSWPGTLLEMVPDFKENEATLPGSWWSSAVPTFCHEQPALFHQIFSKHLLLGCTPRLHWAVGVLVLSSQTCTLFLQIPASGAAPQWAGSRQRNIRPGLDGASCETIARPVLQLHLFPSLCKQHWYFVMQNLNTRPL